MWSLGNKKDFLNSTIFELLEDLWLYNDIPQIFNGGGRTWSFNLGIEKNEG